MCGRFVQVISIEAIEKRFEIALPDGFEPENSYNIAPGDYAYVISSDAPHELQRYQFGMTPNWAKKPMYLFNARSEGDSNRENKKNYQGSMGIISKPSFRKPIRSQRCLVIANAFIEGPEKEKLNKPYAISHINDELFSLAGIWDSWVEPTTGEMHHSFAIITTVGNEITDRIGHHRSPVVLLKEDEKKWLNNQLPLPEVVKLLKPYPGKLQKAVPISVQIKNPKNKNNELLLPVGKTITVESEVKVTKDIKLQGMGSRKKKKDPPDWQRTLFD
ncbi:SOS response-associated peptidase [Marinilabiliaceae bacterium JC017]|nr:SOS response-associated peptidase [Marinilabiliaceae bacterium JC017]